MLECIVMSRRAIDWISYPLNAMRVKTYFGMLCFNFLVFQGNDFCYSKDHMTYAQHSCPNAQSKNVQVPVCPLCNNPVPSPRGQPPDIAVGDHIDRDCQSDPAKKQRKVCFNKIMNI